MSKSTINGFWLSLWQLRQYRTAIQQHLDIPLESALKRARRAMAWALLCMWIGIYLRWPHLAYHWATMLSLTAGSVPKTIAIATSLMVSILSIPIVYGFFRLFTLISHVIAINVFKNRGQRLRLLNTQTTLLSLAPLLSLGLVLGKSLPALGSSILILTAIYTLVVMTYGYGLIFHRRIYRAAGVLVGTLLVTLFIMGIGALAVSVALAVISFFVLVVLRLFAYHP